MRKAILLLAVMLLPVLAMAQATSNAVPFTVTVPQTVPTLTACVPNTANMGAGPVTMSCSGTNFVAASKCFFETTALTTNFVSATQLTCVIPTSLLTVPSGQSSKQYNITVQNPVTVAVTWQDNINPVGTRYNVRRDGALLTSNPLSSLSFDDIGVLHGTHLWGVTAVGGPGTTESQPGTVSLSL